MILSTVSKFAQNHSSVLFWWLPLILNLSLFPHDHLIPKITEAKNWHMFKETWAKAVQCIKHSFRHRWFMSSHVMSPRMQYSHSEQIMSIKILHAVPGVPSSEQEKPKNLQNVSPVILNSTQLIPSQNPIQPGKRAQSSVPETPSQQNDSQNGKQTNSQKIQLSNPLEQKAENFQGRMNFPAKIPSQNPAPGVHQDCNLASNKAQSNIGIQSLNPNANKSQSLQRAINEPSSNIGRKTGSQDLNIKDPKALQNIAQEQHDKQAQLVQFQVNKFSPYFTNSFLYES